MAISRSLQPRQQYGLGSFVKKIGRGIKKVVKSPIGKAALLGAGAYFAPTMLGGLGKGASLGARAGWWKGIPSYLMRGNAIGGGAGGTRHSGGLWGGLKKFGLGKAAFLGAGTLATALPFMGEEEDETVDTSKWWEPSESISKIHEMAKNRHADLKFLPSSIYAAPNYYNMAQGGVASLANGGEAG